MIFHLTCRSAAATQRNLRSPPAKFSESPGTSLLGKTLHAVECDLVSC